MMSPRVLQLARSLRGATTVGASYRASIVTAGSMISHDPSMDRCTTTATRMAAAPSVQPLRSFSSISPRITRAFPQYQVFGETHALALKLIMPSFRLNRVDALVTDATRKGKFMLEFTKRGPNGNFLWDNQIRFALSPEEVGLCCSLLPDGEVDLVRNFHNSGGGQAGDDGPDVSAVSNDLPDKVLKIVPTPSRGAEFIIDFMKDGVGGQSPGPGQDAHGPMNVVVQAGELQVIKTIMQTSIPILIGWQSLVEISNNGAINDAANGGAYGGGGNRGNSGPNSGGFFNGSGDVPF